MTLQLVEVRDPRDFAGAFAAMVKEGADALLLLPDPLFLPHGKQIVDLKVWVGSVQTLQKAVPGGNDGGPWSYAQ